jgi:energy-coupling factor transporter ATP-binding protein EcfA2
LERYGSLGLIFNPFFQGPLYYDNPHFDQLFVDIDDRAETISKMIFSYREVANPLRLQIVGGRGCGKSTLMNAVTRRILRHSASEATMLLPVYCQVSESMYKREPKELSELFYTKIFEEISSLSQFTTKGLKDRILRRMPSGMSKDVAKAEASAAISLFNPFLSVVVPVAREALEAAWKKYQSISPSPTLSSVVETFIENASGKHVKPVLVLDELDKADPRVLTSFFAAERRFFESQNRIIVLATSGGIAEQMTYGGGKVQEIQREFEQLFKMDRLSNIAEATQMIHSRLQWAARDQASLKPAAVIPPEIIERLHYVSDGIPSALMQISFQAIENAVKAHASSVAIEHLPFFVEEMRGIEDCLEKLSRSHKVVLQVALYGKRLTASDREVQKRAKVTRSRLAQILGGLSRRGVLEVDQQGRYRYYSMTERWKGALGHLVRINPKALD